VFLGLYACVLGICMRVCVCICVLGLCRGVLACLRELLECIRAYVCVLLVDVNLCVCMYMGVCVPVCAYTCMHWREHHIRAHIHEK
jgi:hypothetical protein